MKGKWRVARKKPTLPTTEKSRLRGSGALEGGVGLVEAATLAGGDSLHDFTRITSYFFLVLTSVELEVLNTDKIPSARLNRILSSFAGQRTSDRSTTTSSSFQIASTLGGPRNSDAHEMQDFYHHYYGQYIQGLQNADDVDRTRLIKAYQTAAVLFEILKAVSRRESLEVPHEILEAHKLVAEKAEMYTDHSKLPVDPESSHQLLLTQPDVNSRNREYR
ncbi:hypothetical protein L2E82_29935 [Cichorium intybus]|uniref:Uncharacterized protein n=1 Tax=Cichorium intybus TaxID=13427 RepID=A0ACB9CZB1_CICIN|nr:hypothetical protein L2E82_29935 [Cichorium intybus]